MTNYSVELHLKPDAKFVAQPCRRVPYSFCSKGEEKLTELEDMDIIERVEGPTPCVSPIVVVPKQNGDIRICVDMRMAQEVTTFTTHAGLFRYKRLMFGICSAPELYQHVIN